MKRFGTEQHAGEFDENEAIEIKLLILRREVVIIIINKKCQLIFIEVT